VSTVQASVQRHFQIRQLRFLLYQSKLSTASDLEQIRRSDRGVVWLGNSRDSETMLGTTGETAFMDKAIAALQAQRMVLADQLKKLDAALAVLTDGAQTSAVSSGRRRSKKTEAPASKGKEPRPRKGRVLSAATKTKMSEAQRARYAKKREAAEQTSVEPNLV